MYRNSQISDENMSFFHNAMGYERQEYEEFYEGQQNENANFT